MHSFNPFWSDFGSAHCRARRIQSNGVSDYNGGKEWKHEATDSRLLEDEKGKSLEMPNALNISFENVLI